MVSTRQQSTISSPTGPQGDEKPAPNRSSRPKVVARVEPWRHTPNTITVLWLCLSLPVVMWDTGFVLGRPHTMNGGWLHKPLYTPYSLYGTIDYVYGQLAWDEHDGFTGAQSAMNVIETLGYLIYLAILYLFGQGVPLGQRSLSGGWAGLACLAAFGLSVMTFSKTLLYMFNEVFSGFRHIKHNDTQTIILMYLFPNGLWIVLPLYMIFVFGRDILQGLAVASGDSTSPPARAANALKDD